LQEELAKVHIGSGEKLLVYQDRENSLLQLKIQRGSQERIIGLPFSPALDQLIKEVFKVTRDARKTVLLIAQWLDNPKTIRKRDIEKALKW